MDQQNFTETENRPATEIAGTRVSRLLREIATKGVIKFLSNDNNEAEPATLYIHIQGRGRNIPVQTVLENLQKNARNLNIVLTPLDTEETNTKRDGMNLTITGSKTALLAFVQKPGIAAIAMTKDGLADQKAAIQERNNNRYR